MRTKTQYRVWAGGLVSFVLAVALVAVFFGPGHTGHVGNANSPAPLSEDDVAQSGEATGYGNSAELVAEDTGKAGNTDREPTTPDDVTSEDEATGGNETDAPEPRDASDLGMRLEVTTGSLICSGSSLKYAEARLARNYKEQNADTSEYKRIKVSGVVCIRDGDDEVPLGRAVVFDHGGDNRAVTSDGGVFTINCVYKDDPASFSEPADDDPSNDKFWLGVNAPGYVLAKSGRRGGKWFRRDDMQEDGTLKLVLIEKHAVEYNVQIEAPGCGDLTAFRIWGGRMAGATSVMWDEWLHFMGRPDSSGQFSFKAPRGDVPALSANGPGYRLVDMQMEHIPYQGRNVTLVFEAIQTAEVRGSIRDARTGEPVEGVIVQSADSEKTVTDADGLYTIHCENFESPHLFYIHPLYASVSIDPLAHELGPIEACEHELHDFGPGRSEVHLWLRPLVSVSGSVDQSVTDYAGYDTIGLPSSYWYSEGFWRVHVDRGFSIAGGSFEADLFPWGLPRLELWKGTRPVGAKEVKVVWKPGREPGGYTLTLTQP